MTIQSDKKLQNLLYHWSPNVVATTKWLAQMHISRILVSEYKKGGWVSPVGHGAFRRSQDTIEWQGALHALQFQLGLNVHIGAKTALELGGLAHYMPLGHRDIDILKSPKTKVPKWFSAYHWAEQIRVVECSILPPGIGIEDESLEGLNIRVSSRERAALELLLLAPRLYSFDEIPLIFSSLGSLRGDLLNELLCLCSSEKVKRLLLYFGEKQNHAWYKNIDQQKVKTGTSLLKIIPRDGKYISRYKISIPREYLIENKHDIKF